MILKQYRAFQVHSGSAADRTTTADGIQLSNFHSQYAGGATVSFISSGSVAPTAAGGSVTVEYLLTNYRC